MSEFALDRLLHPASIAVVGASERPGAYGSQVLENMAAIGYAGRVYGVNPARSEVHGRVCVASVAELPEAVDAVVVAIPAAGVPEVIEAVGARGCGGAVVLSAGFAEVTGGAELQREVRAAALRHRLPVCGPNCNGIVSMPGRIALWGDAFDPLEPGSVALISQSGNVAVNALNARRGLRFHTVIASGNQVVLSAADYLEALAGDLDVRSIALYLEDDGGPALCDGLAACVDARTRVVVLKVGTSPAGARSAAAHTAAIAGDQRVFRALIEEAGAVWADDVHDLLELAKTLAVTRPAPRPPRIAIMTCSGGDAAQGADEAARLGLELPALSSETCARLSEVLPSAATAANPLDYTAMIWGDKPALSEIVVALGADEAVDHVLVFYDLPAGMTGAVDASWRAVREAIVEGAGRSSAPVTVAATLPELLGDETAAWFARSGVAPAAGLRTALRCVAATVQSSGDAVRLREIAETARAAGRGAGAFQVSHGEREAKELLAGAGVPVLRTRVVGDEDEVGEALSEFGRMVLKVSAPGLVHKSEAGALALDLDSLPAALEAFRRLSSVAAAHRGVVYAEPMVPAGVELLVAARADAVVPALVLALGGIWTEVLADAVVVPLPADADRVERALRRLRGAPLLFGGRGREGVDTEAVARLAESVGRLLVEASLELIELNPVIVGTDGAIAVDAVIRGGAAVAAESEEEEAACTT